MAFYSLKKNFIRSLLTMLGIIVGIASVISVYSLGDGGKLRIEDELENMGTDRVWIYSGSSYSKPLNLSDENNLRTNIENIIAISPVNSSISNLSIDGKQKSGKLIGTNAEYFDIERMDIVEGRIFNFLEIDLSKKVAVVSKDVADLYFINKDPVGSNIKINGHDYKIIGIINDQTVQNGNGEYKIFIPINTWQSVNNNYIIEEYIMKVKQNTIEKSAIEASNLLNTNNRNVTVHNLSTEVTMADKILNTLKSVLGWIAIVCLLSGGIGIMNVMLITVRERTKEIGIRKAIGATDKQVIIQFLIESVVYSVIGGLAGIPIGVIASYVACMSIEVPFILSVNTVLFSFFITLVIGIFFGIYPAYKAAKMRPVEAFKAE